LTVGSWFGVRVKRGSCADGAPERAAPHTQEGMRERGSPTHPHTRLEGDVRFGIAW
jgi:hypothetical protein